MRSFITFIVTLFLSFSSSAQENQNKILANYTSGKYGVYKVEKVSYNKYKMVPVKKQWPIEFTKSGNDISNVLVKRSGILDENFIPDVPGHPAYFSYSTYRLSFVDGLGVYYSWNGKGHATTKYVFVKAGSSLKLKYEELNTKVANYAKSVFKGQTSARANVKEKKIELAEADRKANSLQGKQVSKIELILVNKPSKIAHFGDAINYGIVATLKDGSLLKTISLGGKLPWSDFKLQHKGCSNTIDKVQIDEDAKGLIQDRITLSVVSKYHPTLKAQKYINTTNDLDFQVARNGFYGANRHNATNTTVFGRSQRGGNGHDLTIKVEKVKHKQLGTALLKVEVYDATDKIIVGRYKIKPTTQISIYSLGGAGQSGSDGSSSSSPHGDKGGAGGAGGNVTIIKDSSVSTLNITVNNNGGNGGSGGKRYNINGNNGQKGNTGSKGISKTITQSVSLNF
jgi:hypothetical protein